MKASGCRMRQKKEQVDRKQRDITEEKSPRRGARPCRKGQKKGKKWKSNLMTKGDCPYLQSSSAEAMGGFAFVL